jgi:hypothetical protein
MDNRVKYEKGKHEQSPQLQELTRYTMVLHGQSCPLRQSNSRVWVYILVWMNAPNSRDATMAAASTHSDLRIEFRQSYTTLVTRWLSHAIGAKWP